MPIVQVVPFGQTRPHMPQLVFDVCVFTHCVPPPPPPAQRTCPVGQAIEVWQLPLMHTCVAVQARPHMPQLMLLTFVFTHTPPQRI